MWLAHSKQALGRELLLPQPLPPSRSTLSVSLPLPLFVSLLWVEFLSGNIIVWGLSSVLSFP